VERRGTVYIAPVASYLPGGRLVDPEMSAFYVSWQESDTDTRRGELLEDAGVITGAETAIAWGRERSDRVLIRLSHSDQGQFSAGRVQLTESKGGGREFPAWPPISPPPDGWWTPSDEAAAWEEAVASARREAAGAEIRSERDRPNGPWTGLA